MCKNRWKVGVKEGVKESVKVSVCSHRYKSSIRYRSSYRYKSSNIVGGTLKGSIVHKPIEVSGMASTVFSVDTRKVPWTERPTPCKCNIRYWLS